MALKKVLKADNAEQFQFDKIGKTIKGHFLMTGEIVIDGRPTKRHVFQTEKGMVSCLGSYDLNDQLANLAPGVYAEVEYVGTKKMKKGKQPMKLFEIAYDDENVIDVGSLAGSQQSASSDVEEEAEEELDENEELEADAGEEEAEEEAEEEEPAPRGRVSTGPKRPLQASPEQRARVQDMLARNKKRQ